MNNDNQHIPTGYKLSPLGPIPEDWEVKKLGDLYNFRYGDGNKNPHNNGEYPIYGANGIIGGYTKYNAEDSVVIGHMGEYAGSVIWAKGKHFVTYNGTIATIKDKQKVEDKFGYFVLQNSNIKKICAGSGQPFLSYETLNKISITIPTLPEQHRIVSVLSLWDTAIAKQTALIEKLTLRKRGLMQQLLTGKKRLKGFSGEWRYHKIQDHFTEIRDKNDGKGHIPMTISAKVGLVSQTHKFDRIVAGNSLDKYILLHKGDFAYNKGNSNLYEMGCIYRLKEESAVVPFVYICFRVVDDTCCEFYQQFFINHGLDKQLKQIITSGARGDGLLNVNSEDFMALKIPYPPIKEQQTIATILNNADKEIELANKKLARLQEEKKGLMQVLLTGKRRIKKNNYYGKII